MVPRPWDIADCYLVNNHNKRGNSIGWLFWANYPGNLVFKHCFFKDNERTPLFSGDMDWQRASYYVSDCYFDAEWKLTEYNMLLMRYKDRSVLSRSSKKESSVYFELSNYSLRVCTNKSRTCSKTLTKSPYVIPTYHDLYQSA
jgi:transglutaminase/protease-like cytokinesis protein 3